MRPIHVLRPGRHDGRDWSPETLRQIAESYDAALHEAPIVVGHPRTDDPAYGWVGGLTADASGLHAAPRQVDPTFAEHVRAGRYAHVSVALYGPASPRNPLGQGKGWYLRHVGFLGATPPVVKGLRRAELGEEDAPDATITIALGETQTLNALHRLLRNLREWIIGENDVETADRVLPEYWIEDVRPAEENPEPAFAEPTPPPPAKEDPMPPDPDNDAAKAAADREAALAKREAELAEKEAKLARDADLREQAAFAEKLAADGRIAPAETDAVARALAAIPADAEIELAEGEKSTTRAALRRVLEGGAKRVPYGEAAPPGGAPNGNGAAADGAAFHAPSGWQAAEGGADETYRRVSAYAAKHGVEFAEAAAKVADAA